MKPFKIYKSQKGWTAEVEWNHKILTFEFTYLNNAIDWAYQTAKKQ